MNSEYLGFYLDGENDEVKSELIRKAINYGFDRQKMITYLKNGVGTPANSGFIPNGLPGYNQQKGYTYHPEKAEKLIKEYIRISGNKTPTIRIATDNNYQSLFEFIPARNGESRTYCYCRCYDTCYHSKKEMEW